MNSSTVADWETNFLLDYTILHNEKETCRVSDVNSRVVPEDHLDSEELKKVCSQVVHIMIFQVFLRQQKLKKGLMNCSRNITSVE